MLDASTLASCSPAFIWKLRSTMLTNQLGLHHKNRSTFSMPLMRYIQASYLCIPVKTIVLVERPYRNDIHPCAAAAMSYDPHKSSCPTPSTAIMATSMKNHLGCDWKDTECWFRDSWKFLRAGVFLINVCCFEEFMGNSLNERVSVERFVRDMIVFSYSMSSDTVDLVALGNPAVSSTNRIRSAIADRKKAVKVHRGVNPAGLRHKFGDLTSPQITVGSVELSRALHRAITRSQFVEPLTPEDYYSMTTIKQANTKAKIVNAHKEFDKDMDQVAQFFKSGGKYVGPLSDEQVFTSLRKSATKFVETLIEERVLVMLAGLKENDNVGKGAYSSGHRTYEPKSFNRGSSSEVSAMSKSKPTPTSQKTQWMEEDDPDSPSTPSAAPATAASSVVARSFVAPSTGAQPSKRGTNDSVPATSQRKPSVSVSVSGHSATGTNRAPSKLLFLDEESDPETPTQVLQSDVIDDNLQAELDGLSAHTPSSPSTMSDDDAAAMGVVGEFLHGSGADYGIPASVMQEINEAASSGRAATTAAKRVLEAVRETRRGGSTVERDLGFETGKARHDAPVMQLLLSWSN